MESEFGQIVQIVFIVQLIIQIIQIRTNNFKMSTNNTLDNRLDNKRNGTFRGTQGKPGSTNHSNNSDTFLSRMTSRASAIVGMGFTATTHRMGILVV